MAKITMQQATELLNSQHAGVIFTIPHSPGMHVDTAGTLDKQIPVVSFMGGCPSCLAKGICISFEEQPQLFALFLLAMQLYSEKTNKGGKGGKGGVSIIEIKI